MDYKKTLMKVYGIAAKKADGSELTEDEIAAAIDAAIKKEEEVASAAKKAKVDADAKKAKDDADAKAKTQTEAEALSARIDGLERQRMLDKALSEGRDIVALSAIADKFTVAELAAKIAEYPANAVALTAKVPAGGEPGKNTVSAERQTSRDSLAHSMGVDPKTMKWED